MNKNMGSIDRIIRVALFAVIVIIYFEDVISGTLPMILLIIAGLLIVTSFFSFCPLYSLLGMTTMKKSDTNF